jgi:hypothetical protein
MSENGPGGHGKAAGTAGAEPPATTDLMQEYGKRWIIAYGPDLAVWTAERRSAARLRYFCARESGALAAKLAAAEAGQ